MFRRLVSFLLVFIFIMQGLFLGTEAQIGSFKGKLLGDTLTIRLFGEEVSSAIALKIQLSFSDPDVAHLASTQPKFEASGARELLTEADSEKNIISVIWDGDITNNEAKITAMLAPGTKSGRTNILVTKVEKAGGVDITDKIVFLVNPQGVAAFELKDSNVLGNISILDPGELTSPGRAAIAFRAEKNTANVIANLNNSPVDFVAGDTGVAIVNLPEEGGNLPLKLSVNFGSYTETVNLGVINISPPAPPRGSPHIRRAVAYNDSLKRLRIEGERFGVVRFGKENTKITLIPQSQSVSRFSLLPRLARVHLSTSQCIPEGSYINISHPAGTASKKITVVGNCED